MTWIFSHVIVKIFSSCKRSRDDSGGLPDPSGPLCSKISLPTIEAVNVEVRTVRESQDTPSRSLYHMPFTHAWTYSAATQKVWLIYVYVYQLQCTCKCMCIPVLRFSRYVARDNKAMIKWTHWHSPIFYLSKFSKPWFIKIFHHQNFASYSNCLLDGYLATCYGTLLFIVIATPFSHSKFIFTSIKICAKFNDVQSKG